MNRVGAETVPLLLAAGADVDARNRSGRTPLHQATDRKDNQEVIRILVAAGADVDARDDAGATPLDRTGPGTFGKRRNRDALIAAGGTHGGDSSP